MLPRLPALKPAARRTIPGSLFATLMLLSAHSEAQSTSSAAPTAASSAAHEARVVAAHAASTTGSEGGEQPAEAGATLGVGARIDTHGGGFIVLAIGSATTLTLGENSQLTLFAPASPPPANAPATNDTTISHGTAQVTVAPGSQERFTLATPGGSLGFGAGCIASIRVDTARATQVAVHHGSVRLRSGRNEAVVRSGSGVRADVNRPPQVPHALLAAPTWSQPIGATLFTGGDAVSVEGVYGLPLPRSFTGTPPTASHFHVQIAHDDAFHDVVSDTTAAGTHWHSPALAPGTYFVRVSALDADRFEGPFGPTARVAIVAPRFTAAGNGRRATVTPPDGYFCGIDGAPLLRTTGPISLAPARPHQLRCSERADGAAAREITITTEQSGALSHTVRVEPAGFDSSGGMRVLVVELADPSGAPVAYANISAESNAGVRVSGLRESERRGVYTGTITWARGTDYVRLHFVVNASEQFDFDLGRRPATEQSP